MPYLSDEPPSKAIAGSALGLGFLGGLGAVVLDLLRQADSSVEISLVASSTIVIVVALLTFGVLDRRPRENTTAPFLGTPLALDRGQVLRDLLLDVNRKSLLAAIRRGEAIEAYKVIAFSVGADGTTQVLLVLPNGPDWFGLSELASITIEMHSAHDQTKELPPS